MAKIPLKTRKSIKAALEKAEEHTKKASAAFGKELTFEDNTSELFETLQASGKSEDWLFELGSVVAQYFEQFAKTVCEFCKDNANKEQLEAELTTGKFGIKLTDTDTNEYWRIENGTLYMLTTSSYFGSYLSYFDTERLCKILGKSDSMPLNTRKSLASAAPEISKCFANASKSFGKELSFVDNFQELHDKLKESGKSEDYLWSIGDPLKEYAKQAEKVFAEFCKNTDNKEQLEAELTTGKVGVRISTDSDKYWVLEDGTLWMDTQAGYFGSYLSYFDTERLEKILGSGDSMPLNTRKNLKTNSKHIEKSVQNASKAFGKELSFVDNYQEIYDKLKESGKSQDYLWAMGDQLKDYAAQLEKVFIEFCKNSDNKEQLEVELNTGKVGVRISGESDKYWVLEDGVLWMDTQAGYYGSYLSYFDTDRLCNILGKSDAMPLNSRKNLKAIVAKVTQNMTQASKLFGKELSWVDNFQEIYDKLKEYGKSESDLWTFANALEEYSKQLVTAFTTFCKDNDNKEALEEVLTSGKVGLRLCDQNKSEDDYWVIEDGILWMETKPSYYGSYISYFDSDRLEKKL